MMTGNGKTTSYACDAAGRLTNHAVNGQSRVFEYSFRSQMTSLSDTNGQVFAYAFDGDGNRVSQSLNDCLHARYIYDGPNVVLELNASNEVIHAVVNGPGIDQPVERIAYVNGEPRLRQVYHTDGLGSVALMTDESKTPIKTYAYDAFGRIRAETGELVMNRWTYTGREAMGDSAGLYYYRWRVMDPNTGRFTSEDPLGFVDGPNRYGYVGNGPITYFDAFGLVTEEECLQQLQKASLDILLKGAATAIGGTVVGMGCVAAGLAVGSVHPVLGAVVGGACAGLDYWGVKSLLDKLMKEKDAAQKAYENCMRCANR
ncbi:MAG TPA: RHS repeat-associated core domain-containing protein [Kiritimatiellia bacterium]|nr:RHS repeat-associated core domain-containing protein [Kiritimatiellia bacterium]